VNTGYRGGRQDPRGLDDIDDVDVLETYDWNEDPWDASLGVSEVEQVRIQTRAAKWVGYGALALANLLIIGGGIYGWWYIRQANAPGGVGAPVEFVIAEGEDLSAVSERLEAEGIVENAGFFESYVDDHGGLDVTPGYYRLPTGDHVGNVLARLRTPPEETFVEITFPEGYTLRQMGTRLADELPQFTLDEFLAAANDPAIPAAFRPAGVTSLEGLLFPATYRVSNADSEAQVITRMVEQMERVGAQEEIAAGPTGVNAEYNPYQILTIASMIEREAKTDEDRPLIARVIYNRLAHNYPLQIDATHIYNVPPEQLEEEGAITRLRDVDTPWNTFTNTGLPATPIANPGRASIEAALHPAPNPSPGSPECAGVPADQCEWLYYVIKDEQGNHAFSVTIDQFNADTQAAEDAGLL
jgi:peptidoglycan lytic transglycosylase G